MHHHLHHLHTFQALLSERITDCHVQHFFSGSYAQDATDDYSHINYIQAAGQLPETKRILKEQIDLIKKNRRGEGIVDSEGDGDEEGSLDSFDEEKNPEINDLKDLLRACRLAQARILGKEAMAFARMT